MQLDSYNIFEPLGEASNRGAPSRNAFVCIYMSKYYPSYVLYIRPNNMISDASIDCAIGKMVQLISQNFLWAAKTGSLFKDFPRLSMDICSKN